MKYSNEMELSYLTKYDNYLDWNIIWKHLEKDSESKTIINVIFTRFPNYKTIEQFKRKINKIFSKLTSKKYIEELKKMLHSKNQGRIIVSLTKSKVKFLLTFNLDKKEIIFNTILSRKMENRLENLCMSLKDAQVFGLSDIEEEILSCIDKKVDFSGKDDFFVEMCVDELFAFLELDDKVIEINE